MELDALLTEHFEVELSRLEEIRREAELARVPYAQALVMASVCREDDLARTLADAVGSVVLDLEAGGFDAEAVALVPEAIARQHLLIPVCHGPTGRSLRVAFANPLDELAVEVVRDATGLAVEPLVAPASAVLDAIEREYARRPSTCVVGRPPLRREDTRRVSVPRSNAPPEPADPLDASTTARAHKLDREATDAQRHEALLLALIERGALTRADYLSALKRLLGR